MLANIEAISYITDNDGNHHIITEFSRLPIESFQDEKEAIEFIEGYQRKSNITAANQKGWLFREFVEQDLREGIMYQKVNNLDIRITANV
jgi:hypothetical protein